MMARRKTSEMPKMRAENERPGVHPDRARFVHPPN